MPDIGVRELKTRASEIIREVREERARYVITHRGHPVGLLIPVDDAVSPESDACGATGEDAWGELVRLGEEIGKGWCSPQTSIELLSDMRR